MGAEQGGTTDSPVAVGVRGSHDPTVETTGSHDPTGEATGSHDPARVAVVAHDGTVIATPASKIDAPATAVPES
jgi:hypothetical protein